MADESEQPARLGVMGTAQGAAQATAGAVRTAAGSAAEHFPGAMSGAQDAAGGTARMLDAMPNRALVIGTSFSLGLGIGFFLTGAHRILVLLALAPAAAMASTLLRREAMPAGEGAPRKKTRPAV